MLVRGDHADRFQRVGDPSSLEFHPGVVRPRVRAKRPGDDCREPDGFLERQSGGLLAEPVPGRGLDAENARVAYETFNRIFREGGSVAQMTWEIRRPDSERRLLEVSAAPITDAQGRKTGFRGIARDITDKQLAQKALQDSQACALEGRCPP